MSSRSILTLLFVSSLCGCGTADLPQEVASQGQHLPPARLEPQLLDEAALAEKPAKEGPAEAEHAPTKKSVVAEAKPADFVPPYPNRENLFLAPKRSSTHGKTPGSHEQSVELLGFANVKKSQVILSINGEVFPISEGEQQAGIEVISIQPPAVVLQRNRERWQATLEN